MIICIFLLGATSGPHSWLDLPVSLLLYYMAWPVASYTLVRALTPLLLPTLAVMHALHTARHGDIRLSHSPPRWLLLLRTLSLDSKMATALLDTLARPFIHPPSPQRRTTTLDIIRHTIKRTRHPSGSPNPLHAAAMAVTAQLAIYLTHLLDTETAAPLQRALRETHATHQLRLHTSILPPGNLWRLLPLAALWLSLDKDSPWPTFNNCAWAALESPLCDPPISCGAWAAATLAHHFRTLGPSPQQHNDLATTTLAAHRLMGEAPTSTIADISRAAGLLTGDMPSSAGWAWCVAVPGSKKAPRLAAFPHWFRDGSPPTPVPHHDTALPLVTISDTTTHGTAPHIEVWGLTSRPPAHYHLPYAPAWVTSLELKMERNRGDHGDTHDASPATMEIHAAIAAAAASAPQAAPAPGPDANYPYAHILNNAPDLVIHSPPRAGAPHDAAGDAPLHDGTWDGIDADLGGNDDWHNDENDVDLLEMAVAQQAAAPMDGPEDTLLAHIGDVTQQLVNTAATVLTGATEGRRIIVVYNGEQSQITALLHSLNGCTPQLGEEDAFCRDTANYLSKSEHRARVLSDLDNRHTPLGLGDDTLWLKIIRPLLSSEAGWQRAVDAVAKGSASSMSDSLAGWYLIASAINRPLELLLPLDEDGASHVTIGIPPPTSSGEETGNRLPTSLILLREIAAVLERPHPMDSEAYRAFWQMRCAEGGSNSLRPATFATNRELTAFAKTYVDPSLSLGTSSLRGALRRLEERRGFVNGHFDDITTAGLPPTPSEQERLTALRTSITLLIQHLDRRHGGLQWGDDVEGADDEQEEEATLEPDGASPRPPDPTDSPSQRPASEAQHPTAPNDWVRTSAAWQEFAAHLPGDTDPPPAAYPPGASESTPWAVPPAARECVAPQQFYCSCGAGHPTLAEYRRHRAQSTMGACGGKHTRQPPGAPATGEAGAASPQGHAVGGPSPAARAASHMVRAARGGAPRAQWSGGAGHTIACPCGKYAGSSIQGLRIHRNHMERSNNPCPPADEMAGAPPDREGDYAAAADSAQAQTVGPASELDEWNETAPPNTVLIRAARRLLANYANQGDTDTDEKKRASLYALHSLRNPALYPTGAGKKGDGTGPRQAAAQPPPPPLAGGASSTMQYNRARAAATALESRGSADDVTKMLKAANKHLNVGALGAAVKALQSTGTLSVGTELEERLRGAPATPTSAARKGKYPPLTPGYDPLATLKELGMGVQEPPGGAIPAITTTTLLTCLQGKSRNTAPGISGWSFAEIKDLLDYTRVAPGDDDPPHVLKVAAGLACLCTDIARGVFNHEDTRHLLCHLRGVAIIKNEEGDIRPIGIGSVFMNLANTCMLHNIRFDGDGMPTGRVLEAVGPTEFSIDLPGGGEAVPAALNAILRSQDLQGNLVAAFKGDVTNAFNSVLRHWVVYELSVHFRELHHLALMTYAHDTTVTYQSANTDKAPNINIVYNTGVAQGDVLSMLGFSLVMRRAVDATLLRHPTTTIFGQADDRYLIDEPKELDGALITYKGELEKLGLSLQDKKSAITTFSRDAESLRMLSEVFKDRGIPLVDGFVAGGAPIGTDNYVTAYMEKTVGEYTDKVERLNLAFQQLRHKTCRAQTLYTLVRFCVSPALLTFHTRVCRWVPKLDTILRRFDDAALVLAQTALALLPRNGSEQADTIYAPDPNTMRGALTIARIQLAASAGGLGITSVAETRTANRAGSLALVLNIVRKTAGTRITAWNSNSELARVEPDILLFGSGPLITLYERAIADHAAARAMDPKSLLPPILVRVAMLFDEDGKCLAENISKTQHFGITKILNQARNEWDRDTTLAAIDAIGRAEGALPIARALEQAHFLSGTGTGASYLLARFAYPARALSNGQFWAMTRLRLGLPATDDTPTAGKCPDCGEDVRDGWAPAHATYCISSAAGARRTHTSANICAALTGAMSSQARRAGALAGNPWLALAVPIDAQPLCKDTWARKGDDSGAAARDDEAHDEEGMAHARRPIAHRADAAYKWDGTPGCVADVTITAISPADAHLDVQIIPGGAALEAHDRKNAKYYKNYDIVDFAPPPRPGAKKDQGSSKRGRKEATRASFVALAMETGGHRHPAVAGFIRAFCRDLTDRTQQQSRESLRLKERPKWDSAQLNFYIGAVGAITNAVSVAVAGSVATTLIQYGRRANAATPRVASVHANGLLAAQAGTHPRRTASPALHHMHAYAARSGLDEQPPGTQSTAAMAEDDAGPDWLASTPSSHHSPLPTAGEHAPLPHTQPDPRGAATLFTGVASTNTTPALQPPGPLATHLEGADRDTLPSPPPSCWSVSDLVAMAESACSDTAEERQDLREMLLSHKAPEVATAALRDDCHAAKATHGDACDLIRRLTRVGAARECAATGAAAAIIGALKAQVSNESLCEAACNALGCLAHQYNLQMDDDYNREDVVALTADTTITTLLSVLTLHADTSNPALLREAAEAVGHIMYIPNTGTDTINQVAATATALLKKRGEHEATALGAILALSAVAQKSNEGLDACIRTKALPLMASVTPSPVQYYYFRDIIANTACNADAAEILARAALARLQSDSCTARQCGAACTAIAAIASGRSYEGGAELCFALGCHKAALTAMKRFAESGQACGAASYALLEIFCQPDCLPNLELEKDGGFSTITNALDTHVGTRHHVFIAAMAGMALAADALTDCNHVAWRETRALEHLITVIANPQGPTGEQRVAALGLERVLKATTRHPPLLTDCVQHPDFADALARILTDTGIDSTMRNYITTCVTAVAHEDVEYRPRFVAAGLIPLLTATTASCPGAIDALAALGYRESGHPVSTTAPGTRPRNSSPIMASVITALTRQACNVSTASQTLWGLLILPHDRTREAAAKRRRVRKERTDAALKRRPGGAGAGPPRTEAETSALRAATTGAAGSPSPSAGAGPASPPSAPGSSAAAAQRQKRSRRQAHGSQSAPLSPFQLDTDGVYSTCVLCHEAYDPPLPQLIVCDRAGCPYGYHVECLDGPEFPSLHRTAPPPGSVGDAAVEWICPPCRDPPVPLPDKSAIAYHHLIMSLAASAIAARDMAEGGERRTLPADRKRTKRTAVSTGTGVGAPPTTGKRGREGGSLQPSPPPPAARAHALLPVAITASGNRAPPPPVALLGGVRIPLPPAPPPPTAIPPL